MISLVSLQNASAVGVKPQQLGDPTSSSRLFTLWSPCWVKTIQWRKWSACLEPACWCKLVWLVPPDRGPDVYMILHVQLGSRCIRGKWWEMYGHVYYTHTYILCIYNYNYIFIHKYIYIYIHVLCRHLNEGENPSTSHTVAAPREMNQFSVSSFSCRIRRYQEVGSFN